MENGLEMKLGIPKANNGVAAVRMDESRLIKICYIIVDLWEKLNGRNVDPKNPSRDAIERLRNLDAGQRMELYNYFMGIVNTIPSQEIRKNYKAVADYFGKNFTRLGAIEGGLAHQ